MPRQAIKTIWSSPMIGCAIPEISPSPQFKGVLPSIGWWATEKLGAIIKMFRNKKNLLENIYCIILFYCFSKFFQTIFLLLTETTKKSKILKTVPLVRIIGNAVLNPWLSPQLYMGSICPFYTTGKLGRLDTRQRPTSQETCRYVTQLLNGVFWWCGLP